MFLNIVIYKKGFFMNWINIEKNEFYFVVGILVVGGLCEMKIRLFLFSL